MISNGKKVKIHYTLKVNKEVVDSSLEKDPLEYEQGSGQIIKGLEVALEGLKPGDKKEVFIGPDDAYGPFHQEAIIQVPKSQVNINPLEIGMILTSQTPEGQNVRGIVKELDDENVTVDFNHPLAGKELHFEVEVIEVA